MQTLASLRQALAHVPGHAHSDHRATVGVAVVDAALGGGLMRGALHDVHAGTEADSIAACAFALGLAVRAAGERPMLWVREERTDREIGALYPPGLVALGLDPARMFMVRARNAEAALRASAEGVRCAGLGAVLMTLWGEPRLLDLTASRRLLLAAEGTRVPLLLVRIAARPQPSAAATRWQVSAIPSRPLEGNAPGLASFSVTLLRQRGGPSGQVWRLEWDHEQCRFAERDAATIAAPLSRPVVSISAGAGDAAAMASAESIRRAG